MRVYYEKLIEPIEQSYEKTNTVENVLFMEDIIKDVSKDICVQYKKKNVRDISYEYADLEIAGVIKVSNHVYYMQQHKGEVYNYISMENLKENTFKIGIINSNLNDGDYKVGIYLNGTLIEEIVFTDLYSLYNRKYIKLTSEKLGTSLTITQPLQLNNGEYVTYKVHTINVTEEPAMHRFLCTFDRINNALIFDRKYQGNEINVILQTCGSILRSNTINDLYRQQAGSFVQFDEATNTLTIPNEQVYKTGNTIKYIREQDITITPIMLNDGYNLIGVYLDTADVLTFDIITSNASYSTLLSQMTNYQLDLVKREREYVGFILGLNNISKFEATDIQLYNVGMGGGSGSGSTKIVQDFTNLEEINIDYVASTQVPIVEFYDEDGNVFEPENVHYNLNNRITITLGTPTTGQVAII